jgi:RHS repeat-associated protein
LCRYVDERVGTELGQIVAQLAEVVVDVRPTGGGPGCGCAANGLSNQGHNAAGCSSVSSTRIRRSSCNSMPTGNETTAPDTFGYDQANRLTSAIVAGVTSTYVYDGDGKRISKTVSGVATTYLYDVGGGLPVLLDDGARKYVWGAGLAYSVDKSTAAVQVYHTDGLGSVRAITDSAANVVQTYQTDEFGFPLMTRGTSAQPFGFAGEQRDPEDGLVYLHTRMYDPTIGRFVQRDPLATLRAPNSCDINRFTYVKDNPTSYRSNRTLSQRLMSGSPLSVDCKSILRA